MFPLLQTFLTYTVISALDRRRQRASENLLPFQTKHYEYDFDQLGQGYIKIASYCKRIAKKCTL